MKRFIGDKLRQTKELLWAKGDERILRLFELDALLAGEFYDCLSFPFYQETTGEGGLGTYIQIKDRRPSFRYNLFGMIANQIARKLWAGRHVPNVVQTSDKARAGLEALRDECDFNAVMLEATHWGSVGSVCSVFQIVPFKSASGKKLSKVVLKNIRAKNCSPAFNRLDELSRLRLHFPVQGGEFLNADVPTHLDCEGNKINPDNPYWKIMDLTEREEIVYAPIPLEKWAPIKGKTEHFKPIEVTEHGLGFVPAQWHQIRTGKNQSYDGTCYWYAAVDNIIDLDYTVSQIGSGVRYNAVPQVVVKGQIVNNSNSDGALARGASRWLQVMHDVKEGDHEDKGAEVYMLEANGNAMRIGIEQYAALELRLAAQQICASAKDPDKLTTAMSGKGLEILEAEFLDLSQENRTVFGDRGALKLLKKIAIACIIKKHVLMKGVKPEDVDAFKWGWPPLESIGMVEFMNMATGLAALIESAVFTPQEAKDLALTQIDMPVESASKDYLPTLQASEQTEEPVKAADPESASDGSIPETFAQAIADQGTKRLFEPPIITRMGE